MKTRWSIGKRSMAVALWSGAAVLVVTGGAAAVSFASGDSGRDVLSRQDVDRQLKDQAGSTAPAPQPARSSLTVSGQAVTTSVGAIVVNCDGGAPSLLRYTPKAGYRVDDDVLSTGDTLRLKFESDIHDDALVSISCVNGAPQAAVATQPDDHGGPTNPAPTATDDHGGARGGGQDDPPGDDRGGDRHGGNGLDDPAGDDHGDR